ncbi:MAG: phosphate ABC transporter ATP-binding protein [Vulcanococcus sp.]
MVSNSEQPCLQISDLCVRYGRQTALQNVNASVQRGQVLAVVGPSGCGKSTFLGCLNRMSDLVDGAQVQGSIRLDGEEILTPSVDVLRLRRRVGLIAQRPNPFPFPILRNLTFPLRHHGIRRRSERYSLACQALERVGLWHEVKDRLQQPAHTLSGGQQQRLCLARALVLKPEVLLLDEPCSALDPIASGVVEDLVASLRDELTVVIVTHNLAQARRIADAVAVFWSDGSGGGRLVEQGSVGQIFGNPIDPITRAYIDGVRG